MDSTSAVPARVAIVTGSAQGIGEAIALRLAGEGVDIALLDIAPKEKQLLEVADKIKALGRRAIYILADVTVEDQVEGAVAKCVEELGGLDIVSFRDLTRHLTRELMMTGSSR